MHINYIVDYQSTHQSFCITSKIFDRATKLKSHTHVLLHLIER